MTTCYKGEECWTIEESITHAKLENRERAKKIPELLRQKELEIVVKSKYSQNFIDEIARIEQEPTLGDVDTLFVQLLQKKSGE